MSKKVKVEAVGTGTIIVMVLEGVAAIGTLIFGIIEQARANKLNKEHAKVIAEEYYKLEHQKRKPKKETKTKNGNPEKKNDNNVEK